MELFGMYTKYVSSKRADVKSVLKRKPLVRALALTDYDVETVVKLPHH